MNGPDFDHFCGLVRERSGLTLGPEKTYLVNARLDGIARSNGHGSVAELLTALRKGAPPALVAECVNALATHESSFFRDGAPFEALAKTIIPSLMAARQDERRLRIWCAAASSGQEPYSIAIVLNEMAHRLIGWQVEILATDFSPPILERATKALYSDFEVRRGLSPERLERWFETTPAGYRPVSAVRDMVTFKLHNLLGRAAELGKFDIVLCRNVLIYFDGPLKQQVLGELARALRPDGVLLLGSAESLIGLPPPLTIDASVRGLCRVGAPAPVTAPLR